MTSEDFKSNVNPLAPFHNVKKMSVWKILNYIHDHRADGRPHWESGQSLSDSQPVLFTPTLFNHHKQKDLCPISPTGPVKSREVIGRPPHPRRSQEEPGCWSASPTSRFFRGRITALVLDLRSCTDGSYVESVGGNQRLLISENFQHYQCGLVSTQSGTFLFVWGQRGLWTYSSKEE